MSDKMKEYIEREAALKWQVPHYSTNGVEIIEGKAIPVEYIENLPAADVVEVDVKDLRVKKAIKTLCEFYSTAKKSDYVQKPLAWALYQTWKSFDKMDGGVNDGKAD